MLLFTMQLTTLALAALSAGPATALFRRQDSQASNHTEPEPIAGSYIVEYAPVRIITVFRQSARGISDVEDRGL